MKCKTCGVSHAQYELYKDQCLTCVGKERDQLEDLCHGMLISDGYNESGATGVIVMQKAAATSRKV